MSELLKLQFEFTRCQSFLIDFVYSKGWKLTQGDAYRDPRTNGKFGEKKGYSADYSVHKVKLAHDYNLFIDEKWIEDGSHPAWKEIGDFWKTLHPMARWGGDFQTKDSNHFSFEYVGYK